MTINVRKIALFVLFAVIGVLEIGLRTQAAFRDFTSDLQIYLKYGTFSLALLVFLFFVTKIRTTRMALLPLMYALFSLGSCLYSPDPLFSVSQVLVLLAQLGVVFLAYVLEKTYAPFQTKRGLCPPLGRKEIFPVAGVSKTRGPLSGIHLPRLSLRSLLFEQLKVSGNGFFAANRVPCKNRPVATAVLTHRLGVNISSYCAKARKQPW